MPRSEAAHDWLRPDWPAPSNVHAVCTTRTGGVSTGRHSAMNLGDHVGDEERCVAVNRQRLRNAIGATPIFLRQVHGTDVLAIASAAQGGDAADASVTSLAGTACTIMVADCLPLLFCTADGRHVGAAHAGWRGLAAGVIEATVARLRSAGQGAGAVGADVAVPVELHAWLGPCIGPREFEVGPEVRAAFAAMSPTAASCFSEWPGAGEPATSGRWLADLQALARQRLATLGVTSVHGNDGSDAWCTVRQPSRFFSYRRDGVTGRIAACVWRD